MEASKYVLFKINSTNNSFNYIIAKTSQIVEKKAIKIGQLINFKVKNEIKSGEVVYTGNFNSNIFYYLLSEFLFNFDSNKGTFEEVETEKNLIESKTKKNVYKNKVALVRWTGEDTVYEYGVVSIKMIKYDKELLRGGTYKTNYNNQFYDAKIIDIGYFF